MKVLTVRGRTSFLVLFLLLISSRVAGAAQFSISIRNTSTFRWSEGLVTFSPLLPLGATPTSGARYTTYGFTTSACNVSPNDDGDADLLAANLGLTIGTNAFVVPSINAGATVSFTINATPGQRMSYIADVYGSGTESEDDVIFMHAVGNPTNLSVPLFSSNGLPLANVVFELSGYDTNSTSATNGNGTSCSPKCPVPGSGCFVARGNGTTGAALTAQPAQPNLTLTWTYGAGAGYTTDGVALGNVTGTTDNEIVVLLEAGQYASSYNTLGRGRGVVLSRTGGAELSHFDAAATAHDFMGLPLIENLNGGTTSEYIVSEFAPLLPAPGAASYGRNGDSTPVWTKTGYGYAGFWNMGPGSGNVRTTTSLQIVNATWSGDVELVNPTSGVTQNVYSTWAALGEQVYGHAAVGDVLGTTTNEVVLFGATTGRVIALNANTTGASPQGMTVAWQGIPPAGTYAFGAGPAIGDLDGDGNAEIVVASAGTGRVYAFDARTGTTCKYRWLTPGGFDYTWTSPVIADVDGDGTREVVVLSSDSVLSILARPAGTGTGCRDGVVEWTYTVGNGGPAWFTPAVAQLVAGGTNNPLDVVVANYNTLEVINVATRSIAYRFVDPTAQFYPSAVIEAGSGSPAQIYVSGWGNGRVYRLDAPSTAPTPVAWPTFMGSNTRTGAR